MRESAAGASTQDAARLIGSLRAITQPLLRQLGVYRAPVAEQNAAAASDYSLGTATPHRARPPNPEAMP